MGELKSAVELALERTRNLRLSQGELEDLKKADLMTKAKSLVARYLEANGKCEDWGRELTRLDEPQRDPLKREMLHILLDSVELSAGNDKVFKGINSLTGNEKAAIVEKIKEVCAGFKEELDRSSQKIENLIKEKLKKSGISGSAIKIKAEGSSEWREASGKIATPFLARLEDLKKNLSQASF